MNSLSVLNFHHLQNVPNQEKQTIFGWKWLRVEWNPSWQLVWASGDSCFMSFTSLVLIRSLCSLLYAVVPYKKRKSKLIFKIFYNWIRGQPSVENSCLSPQWPVAVGFCVNVINYYYYCYYGYSLWWKSSKLKCKNSDYFPLTTFLMKCQKAWSEKN